MDIVQTLLEKKPQSGSESSTKITVSSTAKTPPGQGGSYFSTLGAGCGGASGSKKRPATDHSTQTLSQIKNRTAKTASKRLKTGGKTQELESLLSPAPQLVAKRDSWLDLEDYIHPSASQLSVLTEED